MEKGVRLDEEKLCDRQHRVFIFPSQNILQKDIRDNGYEELSIYMEWGERWTLQHFIAHRYP